MILPAQNDQVVVSALCPGSRVISPLRESQGQSEPVPLLGTPLDTAPRPRVLSSAHHVARLDVVISLIRELGQFTGRVAPGKEQLR